MSDTERIEQRVAALEQTVQELQQQVQALGTGTRTRKPWWDAVVGSMADFPEFDQVMEFVRQARDAELAEFDRNAAAEAEGPR